MPSNMRGAVLLCLLAGFTCSAGSISSVNYAPDRFSPSGETAPVFLLPDTMYEALTGLGGPTLFVTFADFKLTDGMFLPASYGALDGEFLAAGLEFAIGESAPYSAGRRTPFAPVIGTLQFANDVVAPEGSDSTLANDDGGLCSMNSDLVDTIIPGGIGLTIATFVPDCALSDCDSTTIAISHPARAARAERHGLRHRRAI